MKCRSKIQYTNCLKLLSTAILAAKAGGAASSIPSGGGRAEVDCGVCCCCCWGRICTGGGIHAHAQRPIDISAFDSTVRVGFFWGFLISGLTKRRLRPWSRAPAYTRARAYSVQLLPNFVPSASCIAIQHLEKENARPVALEPPDKNSNPSTIKISATAIELIT